MIFHRSLSHSNYPPVSRTLLSSQADFHNALVWKVSIHPLISNSCRQFPNFLWAIPCAITTRDVTVTLTFHNFFISLARTKYSSIFSISFIFSMCSTGTAKSTRWQVLFFLLLYSRSVLLVAIWRSFSISKFQRILCVSFSVPRSLFSMVKFQSHAQFLVDPFSHAVILYSFSASLLHVI